MLKLSILNWFLETTFSFHLISGGLVQSDTNLGNPDDYLARHMEDWNIWKTGTCLGHMCCQLPQTGWWLCLKAPMPIESHHVDTSVKIELEGWSSKFRPFHHGSCDVPSFYKLHWELKNFLPASLQYKDLIWNMDLQPCCGRSCHVTRGLNGSPLLDVVARVRFVGIGQSGDSNAGQSR